MKANLLFATVLAIAGVPAAADDARDTREILRVEAELCRAFETGDADTLRKSLDPRFTLVSSSGVVTGFAENMAEIEQREPSYEIFRNHGQDVRLHGDAAVVTGITTVKGRAGDKPFAADFRFTDTWIRRGDSWVLAASHASRLPEDKVD